MGRTFNIAGPNIASAHYCLPPERRLARARQLIGQGSYFTLHAGRQTGKTTSLIWLEQELGASGQRALWVDLQPAREQPDPAVAFRSILGTFEIALQTRHPAMLRPDPAEIADFLRDPSTALSRYIRALAARDQRPLVLLLDEADGLIGPTMVSFLTQLREGYTARAYTPFAASVVLVGMRQVRDYVVSADERRTVSWLGTTSPFNITSESLTLAAFREAEVGELVGQHTAETGQRFSAEAIARIWELGRGHPWLTNALAEQVVARDVQDLSVTITREHVDRAKEALIRDRRTHIDSLIARLREPRVQRVLEPMLTGGRPHDELLDDDLSYVQGLGLVDVQEGMLQIANPIYREVIPRALTWNQQITLPPPTFTYIGPEGRLDLPRLMDAWQVFWRKDGHLAAEGFAYREAGPHLMLMAFLQRVINGGGQVEREYGLGRGALDLLIRWRGETYAIEVKLRRDTETETEALDQVAGYLEHLGLSEGWLVLFDLRKGRTWAERLTRRDVAHLGRMIHIVGS